MKVAPGDENQAADVVSGAYELHHKIQPGEVVYDIGAHVGYFTTVALERVGDDGVVFAFEPHPDNYKRLQENTVGLKRLVTFNSAAWDYDGKSKLYTMPGNSGGHSLFPFQGHGEIIEVELKNIRRLIRASGISPTFVKIDAENSELVIVRAILSTCEPENFAMEMHTKELHRDCSELFAKHGYEFTPKEHTSYHFYAWKP